MSIRGFVQATDRMAISGLESLDPSQRAVIDLPDDVTASVIGAPGSGKTTTLIEVVANRILERGWRPSEVLALTTSRGTATRLRDRLAARIPVPTNGPLARTVNSLAFDVVTQAARAAGAAVPTLVTGAEQDSDIAQLLAGQIDDGDDADWPDPLSREVRGLRAFRTELRELMMRATEYGVTPKQLDSLGSTHDRPEWRSAARFMSDYLAVVSASRSAQLDSAELAQFAGAALAGTAPLLGIDSLRLVVIDDFHEVTESALAVIRGLTSRGVAVVAFGDPDIASNSFRGGEADALGRLGVVLGRPETSRLVLSTVYRHSPALRAVVSAATSRIGTAAAGTHRIAEAIGVSDTPAIVRLEADTPSRQWAAVARRLRERHLLDGMDWSRMAIVVRSGAHVSAVARSLAIAEVPSRLSIAGRPLRDDSGASSLMTVVDIGSGRTDLDGLTAESMLLGPYGGLDRLELRRLVLALRAEELAADGHRTAHELLVEALTAPGRLATIDHRVARRAARLTAILERVGALARNGASAEEVLWEAWHSSGLAPVLHEQAIGAGITATEANRHLDGVVALFSAAKRFAERNPGTVAQVFLDSVLDADVPEDTLSPRSSGEAVLVTTPAALVGREFDVVVVGGLQDGAWPNLRLRGSLLGAHELVRLVTGAAADPIDERRQVLGDELRMFALAVSRARSLVILTAITNDDEAPSLLFSLGTANIEPERAGSAQPLTLRGLTGRLRRELLATGIAESDRQHAAQALARLAAEQVPGADPSDWHGLRPVSSEEPLYRPGETVPVSPSRLEKFEKSPVDWFIDTIAGSESSTAMGVGTILHWAMETATDTSIDSLWSSVEHRWKELVFEAPWLAEQQKRMARMLVSGIAEYLTDFERDNKRLIAAEGTFSIELPPAKVNGSIDRIEQSADGSVVIVDLKTGNPIKAADVETHAQLGAYQLAYAEGVLGDVFRDVIGDEAHSSGGAKLLFVKKGKSKKLYSEAVQAPLDEAQLGAFRERILTAAAGMAAAEFSGMIEVDPWAPGDTTRITLHRVPAISSDGTTS